MAASWRKPSPPQEPERDEQITAICTIYAEATARVEQGEVAVSTDEQSIGTAQAERRVGALSGIPSPPSLRSGRRIPKQLPGQLQVALVQCAMFDGVQQRVTYRHRLFSEHRMIVSRYTRELIQSIVGERR